jgi:flagellar hook protein FlgE
MTDAAGAIFYSRNGQFQMDKNGFLVNNQGHVVSGYLPNAAGVIVTATPVPMQISAADLKPNMTTNAVVGANLDSRAAVPLTAVFNSADPTSYNNSTSLSVYDSLGASHVGTMYFQRQAILPTTAPAIIPAAATTATVASAAGLTVGNTITIPGAGPAGVALTATISNVAGNVLTFAPATTTATVAGAAITSNAPSPTWKTFLTVDGVVVAGAAAVPPAQELATLTFDTLGKLASTLPVSAPIGRVTSAALFPGSTTISATQALAFDFGSPTAGTTQYGGTFGVNTLTQDGYTSGRLNSTSTSADGTILGRYSNGQSRALGQVVLVNFTSPQGLQPVGNNEWVGTFASGGPLVGVPGSSSLGVLQSSATEDSNVDLTAELVNMITAQRVYQANAQTIKTQDSLLQTIVSLR